MPYLRATAPHIRDSDSISKMTWRKTVSLLPILLVSLFVFRFRALGLMLAGVTGGILAEWTASKAFQKRFSIQNGSTVLYSLLLTFFLPPSAPLWVSFFGAFFSVGIGKEMCGGLGGNLFHPAVAGLVILKLGLPFLMLHTRVIPQALPVISFADFWEREILQTGFLHRNIYEGTAAAALGSGSLLAILAGVLVCHVNRTFYPEVPWIYLGGIFLGLWSFSKNPFDAVGAGNVLLAAFWIVTDEPSTPVSRTGKRWFAFGAGLLGIFLNERSVFCEGALCALLIMNALVPWLDQAVKPAGPSRVAQGSVR